MSSCQLHFCASYMNNFTFLNKGTTVPSLISLSDPWSSINMDTLISIMGKFCKKYRKAFIFFFWVFIFWRRRLLFWRCRLNFFEKSSSFFGGVILIFWWSRLHFWRSRLTFWVRSSSFLGVVVFIFWVTSSSSFINKHVKFFMDSRVMCCAH